MAYQMQSLREFYCRRCKDKKPGALSMSWITDDLICPTCKSKEKHSPDYTICKEVELLTLKPYYTWSNKIKLVQNTSMDDLFVGEYNSKKFLFKRTDKQKELFMFIKILK